MLIFFLKIILLFFIPANISLLFLLRSNFDKKSGNYFSLLVSYGVAPLLNGLMFYYSLWFFPKSADFFYSSIIFLFWTCLFIYSKGKIQEILFLYANIFTQIRKNFTKLEVLIYLILFFITLLFSIQALIYPVAEGDSAYYFLQTEALNQSKDAHWQNLGVIFLHKSDEYSYNPMIRPGIPSSVAFLSIFENGKTNIGMFKFFYVYYYYLLLGIFLLVVSKLSLELEKNQRLARFFAFLFFVFYWNMTRFYIFNNKEVSIFFFALAGLYVVYELILLRKRDYKQELLLGAILGLNAFVNLHGILIAIFSLITLFVFSKLPFWQRMFQGLFIFIAHLFFSCFEIVSSFGFIFWDTLANILQLSTHGIQDVESIKNSQYIKGVEVLHFNMYQTPNLLSVYLKGKLQIITNTGSYGFYFLVFLGIVIARFKEIISSIFGRLLLFFVFIYYFIIIDPLNINKNDLAVVLWGSPKYAMLVVLFALIFVAVYFESWVKIIFNFISKRRISYLGSFSLFFIVFVFLKNFFLTIGLKLLMNLVQISRNISFYVNKVEIAYYGILGVLLFLILFLYNLNKIKKDIAFKIFLITFSFLMIMPFFIADPGKVPLSKTFSYVSDSEEIKLKNIIYFGDLFEVYYYAKDTLPKGTLIRTNYMELYTYNSYFKLRGSGDVEARYEIVGGKCFTSNEVYDSGEYSLCEIEK